MRELPPAREEERDLESSHAIKSLNLSAQGGDLPRSCCLREIHDGSRATPGHAQVMAFPRRQRRLARWPATAAAGSNESSLGRAFCERV